MDLKTSIATDASQGAWLTLRDPKTGLDMLDDGKPVRLKLAGKDSDQWRAAEDDNARRIADDAARSRRYKAPSPEQSRAAVLRLYGAITLDWENCAYGGVSAFSTELVKHLYATEKWALEQVAEFVDDRANFAGASKTT